MIIRLIFFVYLGYISLHAKNNLDSINLQLRWHHQFQFAGYYAAVEKGFYKDEGLDVTISPGSPNRIAVNEVLENRAQYGVANSGLILQKLNGAPLVAVAVIFQHSASVLLTKKTSGLATPHDLIKKKTMLLSRHSDTEFITMFNNEGIDPNLIDILPSSFKLDDLINEKVDAFSSYITNETYHLKQQGIAYNVISPSNYGVDFYSDILFTTQNEVQYNFMRIAAMKRASLRGWKYAMQHPDEIIDLLIEKYKVTKPREHLEYEAKEMEKLILPSLIEIGHINPERFEFMARTIQDAGLAPLGTTLDGFIYNPKPTQVPIKFIVNITIAFMIIIVVILIWNYTLRVKVKRAVSENEEIHQNLMEQKKKAEMGTIVANISHQWREPLSKLSAINMLNTMNLEENKNIDNELLLKRYNDIEYTIEFMSTTMQSFLQFYKQSSVVEKFSVAKSIEHTLFIIETKLLDNTIDVNINIINDFKISGIQNEWMNVWLNLINNSIEALKNSQIQKPNITITIDTNFAFFYDNAGGMDMETVQIKGLGHKMCTNIIDKYNSKFILKNIDKGLSAKILFNESIVV